MIDTITDIGGRALSRHIARIAQTREGVGMTYDKGRVGLLMPVPKSQEEAFSIMKSADKYDTDRALKTATRKRLLDGEIIWIATGRSKVSRLPEAVIVPYPYTVTLAMGLAERVWRGLGEVGRCCG